MPHSLSDTPPANLLGGTFSQIYFSVDRIQTTRDSDARVALAIAASYYKDCETVCIRHLAGSSNDYAFPIDATTTIQELYDTPPRHDTAAQEPIWCWQENDTEGLQTGTNDAEIELHLTRTCDGVLATWNRSRFEQRDIAWILCCVEQLAQQLRTADWQQPARGLSLVPSHRLNELVQIGTNRTPSSSQFFDTAPTGQLTLPALFEAQVARTPDRIAVTGPWGSDAPSAQSSIRSGPMTYRELNCAANEIASWLLERGLQIEEAVGVHLTRSPAMLATLIGIMKAGGCYVPMLADLPTDRLSAMVEDANVRFLITEDKVSETALALQRRCSDRTIAMLNIDRDSIRHQQPLPNPSGPLNSHNLAYIIFTSGSTGRPKGVPVEHRSLANFCAATNEMLEFCKDSVSLAVTTIAFDVSVAELFPLLTTGGQIAIAAERVGANGQLFEQVIRESKASYLCATPTSLRILAASGWAGSDRLTVITGGEPISRETVNDVRPRCGRLINGYGPTEATVYSTYANLAVGSGPVPIGFPLLNLNAYIVDTQGRLVPPNVRGELCIGGQALARGYLNLPEQTDEKFLPDPFIGQPNARMYLTGDIAWMDHDGIVFYGGRKDNQVKIRGYRIELGEIEMRLNGHPGVADAVVIVREDQPDQKRLVAYLKPTEQQVSAAQLQDHLADALPEYMIPSWLVRVDAFPMTPNGKLDRKSFLAPEQLPAIGAEDRDTTQTTATDDPSDIGGLSRTISGVWTSVLGRRIGIDDEVFRMGADSLAAVKFQLELESEAGIKIPVGEIFQYRTPALLAARLSGRTRTKNQGKRRSNPSLRNGDIAIIGMAGRFPGAKNLDQFWSNLTNGVESIREFSAEELAAAGVTTAEHRHCDYVPRGADFAGGYEFEPEMFGVTRQDAEILSPQIRLFMTSAFEAMQSAGYAGEPKGEAVGVFAGSGYPNYLSADFGISESQRLQRLIGNGADYVATRTSYALGLSGPALSIQTACSTSLVTVVRACQAIRNGECSMAIAGGSSFSWPAGQGYRHGEGLIYSSDGHCRPFDSRASGTIFSQGSGAVVLRSLDDAIDAGDNVIAVIRGVATNNDGNRKSGFAAPSIDGQAEVIGMAIDDADINPENISYVEAHGTGTKIGDPIEISGLTQAWRDHTDRTQYCSIGSVKSNIGHADSAAGIAGLLKVVLSIRHRQLPPTLHFDSANPEIDFANTPFRVQTTLDSWDVPEGQQLIGAVSAFGLGGTNAHIVLSEFDGLADPNLNAHNADLGNSENGDREPTPFRVVPMSARTTESLDAIIDQFANLDRDKFPHSFENIVHTLRDGRPHLKKRAFAVANDRDSMSSAINNAVHRSFVPPMERDFAFLFTGQGSQYAHMAAETYRNEPVFRNAMDRCDELLREQGLSLTDWLYSDSPQLNVDITQTKWAQLALFAVSFSQAQLWMSWGIMPSALAGHSIGEYAAAAVAEVMSLRDAISIVATRGRMMQSMSPGSMLAVMTDLKQTQQLLAEFPEVDIAVLNSDQVTVVAGPSACIKTLERLIQSKSIRSRLLKTSHAFHSRMMEPMLDDFRQFVDRFKLSPPKIPLQSNVTGTWMTDEQACSADYWASQVRETVQFSENVRTLVGSDDPTLFLEMGPGGTLTQLIQSQATESNHAAISTIPAAKNAGNDSAESSSAYANQFAVGQAWASGARIDFKKIDAFDRMPKRVPLPTYPFQFATYRIEEDLATGGADPELPFNEWFHVPVWKQCTRHQFAVPGNIESENTLSSTILLVGPGQDAKSLGESLQLDRDQLINVALGDQWQSSKNRFQIDPSDHEHWKRLFESVGEFGAIIHAASLNASGKSSKFEEQFNLGAGSLIWLAKAFAELPLARQITLTVLTVGATDGKLNQQPIDPANHALLGTLGVIQKEVPALTTQLVDVGQEKNVTTACVAIETVINSRQHHPLLAFDRGQLWKSTFETISLESKIDDIALSESDVIVVIGGLGELALAMAQNFAATQPGLRFVLMARDCQAVFEASLIETHDHDDSHGHAHEPVPRQTLEPTDEKTRRRIEAVRVIQEAGCLVDVMNIDCSDGPLLQTALDEAVTKYGRIDYILHAAGVIRDGIIATKTAADIAPVYQSKVEPAFHLRDWLRRRSAAERSTTRVVMFSSISADLAPFGQSDYAGANNILDGLAAELSESGIPAVSVNWPAFAEVGMASRSKAGSSGTSALARELSENALFVDEGAESLRQILVTPDLSRVVVSRRSFEPRRQLAIEDGRSVLPRSNDEAPAAKSEGSPRERMLEIWRDQFGDDEFGIDDNFFEAGGDSLMAVGMIGRVEQAFGVVIPISHLINSPTANLLLERMGLVEDSAYKESATCHSSNCDSPSATSTPTGCFFTTQPIDLPRVPAPAKTGR